MSRSQLQTQLGLKEFAARSDASHQYGDEAGRCCEPPWGEGCTPNTFRGYLTAANTSFRFHCVLLPPVERFPLVVSRGWCGAEPRGRGGVPAARRVPRAGCVWGEAGQAGTGDQLAVLLADQQVVRGARAREVEGGGDVAVGVAVGHVDRAGD